MQKKKKKNTKTILIPMFTCSGRVVNENSKILLKNLARYSLEQVCIYFNGGYARERERGRERERFLGFSYFLGFIKEL
jgi:hypothetical protein